MLKGFMSFLEGYIDEAGSTGVVKAALGIFAFASVLSAVFGSNAFKAAALVLSVLINLSLLIVLTRENTKLRHDGDSANELLSSHCDWVYEQTERLWRIDHWEEDVTISSNGDAVGTIIVKALVEAEDLTFFRLRIGPNWNQPEKYRRGVKVTVNPGDDGAEWKRTLTWKDRGKLEILTHFGSAPPTKGEELTFRVEFTWPGKAIPLMRHGGPDEFVMKMGRPLAYFSYRITLPAGSKVQCSPLGLHKSDDFELTKPTDARPVAELVARDVEADHRIGVRLNLR